MAVSGTIQISGTIFNLPEGGPLTIGPLSISSAAAIGESLPVSLAGGNNPITVPTGATALLFIPPTGNVTTITLKGISGDTGIVLAPALPFLLPVTAGSTIVLTTGGAINAKLVWI